MKDTSKDMLRNTNGRPVGGEGTSSQPWRVEILSKTRTLGQAGSTRSRQSMPLLVPTHLFHILQSYAALVPPQYLQCSTNGFHDFVVEFVFDNPHFKLYPPSRKYQCTFWRWAIHELETIAANEARSIVISSNVPTKSSCIHILKDIEIDDRIYDYYVTLLPSAAPLSPTGIPLQAPPSPSYITHFWSPEPLAKRPSDAVDLSQYQTTTLLESRTTIESGTTGLRTWLASLVLSQYLILHPGLSENTHYGHRC